MDCEYCGYFNGLVAYDQEIGGRSEQYRCPIKHARTLTTLHNRYAKFIEHVDGSGYREQIETAQRDFNDLK